MSNTGKKYKDRHANRRLIRYFLSRCSEDTVVSILSSLGYEVKKVGK